MTKQTTTDRGLDFGEAMIKQAPPVSWSDAQRIAREAGYPFMPMGWFSAKHFAPCLVRLGGGRRPNVGVTESMKTWVDRERPNRA